MALRESGLTFMEVDKSKCNHLFGYVEYPTKTIILLKSPQAVCAASIIEGLVVFTFCPFCGGMLEELC